MEILLAGVFKTTKEEFMTMGTPQFRKMLLEAFLVTGFITVPEKTEPAKSDGSEHVPLLQGGNDEAEKEQGDQAAIEALAAKFHEIYQAEAERQGDVRHQKEYADLPENIKEYDRALAKYVLANFEARK